MSFSHEDIKKIADLARISVNNDQTEQLSNNLSNILAMVDKINQANTDNVAPLANPLDSSQSLRDDVVTETNQRDQFQAIAPKVHSGLYIVPKVIDAE